MSRARPLQVSYEDAMKTLLDYAAEITNSHWLRRELAELEFRQKVTDHFAGVPVPKLKRGDWAKKELDSMKVDKSFTKEWHKGKISKAEVLICGHCGAFIPDARAFACGKCGTLNIRGGM